MNVSENIKLIRESKGIKQADVAKAIGIERTNYHRIENKGSKLTLEQLMGIANALGVSVTEIIDPHAKDVTETTKRIKELEIENQELKTEIERSNRVVDALTYMFNGGKGMDKDRVNEIMKNYEPDLEEVLGQSMKRMERP